MFKAGASRVDVTPSNRVYLAGFSLDRPSVGVHDKLYASTVAVQSEDNYLVLVSIDLIGLFKDFLDTVRKEAVEAYGLKPEEIIFCCTHTHSGPDTIGLWGPDRHTTGVDEEYMELLRHRLIESIGKALGNMTRVRATYSWVWVEPKGIVKNTRNPGLVDRYLSTLRLHSESEGTVATIVNFACHPEVLSDENKLITSDYVHYLRSRLEEKIGGVTVFVNGPLGGMLTPDVEARSFDEAERIGEELARWTLESLVNEREIKNETIWVKRREFTLPVENPKFLEAEKIGVLERSFIKGRIKTEVVAASVGEVTVLTIPGEALPRIGMEVRGALDGKCKILACLGNDEIGYIIPVDNWTYSRYEETMSLGPSTASTIQEEIKGIIQENGG